MTEFTENNSRSVTNGSQETTNGGLKVVSGQRGGDRKEPTFGLGPNLLDKTNMEKNLKIAKPDKDINQRLISLLTPSSMEAERYHRLRQSVEDFCQQDREANGGKGKVVAITSPVSGEGKTVTSINLAGALAQNPNAKVLLVELDIRQRFTNIKENLGLRSLQGPGLVGLVSDSNLKWEDATYYMPDFNLHFLPAGQQTDTPYEILRSPRLGEIFDQIRDHYDVVIVDTAPVVLVPDSQLISKWVDGFLVVVAADSTRKKMLAEALNLMDGKKVMGIVFNGNSHDTEKFYNGHS